MRAASIFRAIGCVAALVMAGIAAAGPGDRIQRHPLMVCTNCGNDDMLPATAADAAGNSIVVWARYDASEFPDFGLWARSFGPDGRPRGDQFRITPLQTSFEGYPRAPFVAMRADGAFVVTWVWHDTLGVPSFVRARLFGSDGAPQSGVITVNGSANYDRLSPNLSVAMDDDGDFVVVWTSVDSRRGNTIVWARLYDSVGTPKGAEFPVDATAAMPRFPDVAMDAAGNFIVVWQQLDVDGQKTAIFGRRYEATGAAREDRFPVSMTGVAGDPGIPAVAMAGSGAFAVAFDRSTDSKTMSMGVFGRRFDAAGAPLGGEFRASAVGRATGWTEEVDIDMDKDGDFIVIWMEQDAVAVWPRLHARLYAASGAPLMPDRAYGLGQLELHENVAMDAVGNFVVTWAQSSWDPNNTGFSLNVFVQHFTGPDDRRPGCAGFIAGIVGTAADDSLRGTSGDDVIHGLGGDDILMGRAGADIICGGAGADQLFGELGRDNLLGGPDDDILDGGPGNDRCNGNRQENADTALACERVLQVP